MGQPRTIQPVIRSAYNNTGASIPAKRFVTGPKSGVSLPAAATDVITGVTMQDIPDKSWGDVQVGGVALVEASAPITAGARVQPVAATGKAATFAGGSGNSSPGVAETGAGADTDIIEVELAIPANYGAT
jgi:hypothetical protein